jgi:hypothetical protein
MLLDERAIQRGGGSAVLLERDVDDGVGGVDVDVGVVVVGFAGTVAGLGDLVGAGVVDEVDLAVWVARS